MKCALIGGLLLWTLAATAATIDIRVTETAGIRRGGFPASARVHFAQGQLVAARNARMMLGGKETAAQFMAESSWPDGSIEWLNVDWGASVGPGESATYQLEYGPGVTTGEGPRNGVTVVEDADGFQVGQVRFGKSANPLLASVKYRMEDVGEGLNGVYATDASGKHREISGVKAEVVKRGPLWAMIRYTGKIELAANYSVPVTITVKTPNGRTLVEVAVSIDDPGHRLQEIGLGTPLNFTAPMPWLWDFGTFRWTYGSLRNAADSVVMTQTPAGDWTVQTGTQVYEKSPAGHALEPVTWGHFHDGKEVVAFAVDRGKGQTGTWRVTFNGAGQALYSFVPQPALSHYEFAVTQHFVTSPVQLGAVTTPSALLSPLEVTVLNP